MEVQVDPFVINSLPTMLIPCLGDVGVGLTHVQRVMFTASLLKRADLQKSGTVRQHKDGETQDR